MASFLLQGDLRFRSLTSADIDIDSDLLHLYQSTRNDSPLSRHSFKLRGMVHLSVITILRLRSASEI
jgi:hypothetical protein